ncbi:MAG TPA: glycoside hydrolase family 3 C-terminal domain-containing protein [Acidimicrobiales bacterium]|nr:glycoside hydrolase family 3 C-terminal domain-containing protein [Acidimicrobiales bacterium]
MGSRRRLGWRHYLALLVALVTLGLVVLVADPIVVRAKDAADSTGATATSRRVGGRDPCPWLDSTLPVATRVDELLRAMTPLQEATLLHLLQVNPAVPYQGYTPAIPSLCIPQITEQDGAAGVANSFDLFSRQGTPFPAVTQLPAPIADAAAFDPDLARQYGNVIGAEDATKGIDLALSPTINIDRSPLWGRSYETLGEDPFLTASLAPPLVQGIQANRVVSVLKHFAVYNQETNRATALDNSIVSDRALHEVYLPAFSAATQAGNAGAVMCSYNLINGVPACQDPALINGILRGDWHFAGFVRSDCDSVYNQAAAMSVGVSQVKCTHLYSPQALAMAVSEGQLARSELDGLARPLLTVLFHYDLIASPHPLDPGRVATTPAHQAVAARTNAEGAVLLKNDHNLLPLDFAHVPSVALIGPAGGTPMPAGLGAMHVTSTNVVTAEAALAATLGPRLRYDPGADVRSAAALARHVSVAIVVVHDVEAERHDRTSLVLPGNQNALVAAVAAANPRTVVVLESGSAVLMPWINAVPAVLETWYPGETAGTSLVAVLSGRVNPSGKLPVSFPKAETPAAMPDATAATFGGTNGQVQYADNLNVGYRWYQANNVAPLFSFGYGLSYTGFRFSHLQATAATGVLTVHATVTNVGPVSGADVVQCYVGFPATAGEPPRQLRGFVRVNLAPKKSQTVQFSLTPGDLAIWDSAKTTWSVPAGTFEVFVGDGSDLANLPLTATVQLAAASLGVNSGPAGS